MSRRPRSAKLFPGASSALRGYRLQHLYTLFRMLIDDVSAMHEFQLEGTEDLEIFDGATAIEAIQVKARSSAPLTPSALSTKAGESFFRRAVERLQRDPGSKQRIVSFGEVGPSLELLCANGAMTDKRRAALAELGVPSDRADLFGAAFTVERVSEDEIERTVLEKLAARITSGNPQVAFLYLSGWMYRAMEGRHKLTASDVQDRLLSVGRFIAEAQARESEWFTTIEPIEERTLDEAEQEWLAREFYDGVSARFDHILAGVDVVRSDKLTEIAAAFTKSNVVIVHGASGQGKTALACRFLLSANPSAWRFRVRQLQDIPHAQRVVLALRSHAEAVGVPMIVWLDVAPQDTAWTLVVEDLETLADTHVLITIREEDWTRARNAGAAMRHADIALTLDEPEARGVFDGLQLSRISPDFLDFADAWQRFGCNGPLMEFTYFVTRGDALAARLEGQVRRLREEVRLGRMSPVELELLRRVAVATAAGGRVGLKRLLANLRLPDPAATVALFESEYLLRVSEDRAYAESLHPLRSTLIARLLTANSLDPSWLETAIAALPALDEVDLEAFLLSLFTLSVDCNSLKAALMTFKPKTWSGGAGVVRALLWTGIQEYTSANGALIAEAFDRGFDLALAVLDPAGLSTFSPFLTATLKQIFSVVPEVQQWYEDMQARKPSNACVFRDASAWLRGLVFEAPSSPLDWAGMAELLFWFSAWGMASEQCAAEAIDNLERSKSGVTLEAAAEVVFALSFWDGAHLPSTWQTIHRALLERFQLETRTFAIIIDDVGATAHYTVSLDEHRDLHQETIRRLDLMRRLMPAEKAFGAQAYGHIFGSALFPHDPSTKRGVPAALFPIPWVTRLSGLFSLIAWIQRRGISWGKYANDILLMRKMIVTLASVTTDAIRKYFNRERPKNIFELGVDKIAWYRATVALTDLPKLPRSTVDDWGFETRQKSDVRSVEMRSEHADWEKALKVFTHEFREFLESSTPYLLANCHLGRPSPGSEAEIKRILKDTDFTVHLASYHLAEALRCLLSFQSEYRSRFTRFSEPSVLPQLESDEQDRLWTLWVVWYQFAERPKQRFADARRESLTEVAAVLKRRRADLKRRLDSIAEVQVSMYSERGQWGVGKGLWLTMNVQESESLYSALDATLGHVIEALRPPPDHHALDRYVLDLVWRDVHVVPLVRGKSTSRKAWCFRIAALPQPGESIKAWELIPRDVDDETWAALNIDVWPATLGGVVRRMERELAAVDLLTDHLLRFESAPEPDPVGKSILASHWNEAMGTVCEHASRALTAAGEISASLFADGEASVGALRTVCDQITRDLEAIEPMSFGALRNVSGRIKQFTSETVAVVVYAAIDAELDAQAGGPQ